MRTTVTLDDDLAIRLERRQTEQSTTFKEVLNDVIRRGLETIDAPSQPQPHIQIEPLPLGRQLINLDNIADALAIAEGENYR